VSLPVEAALPALRKALAERGAALLTAEPGAGKTTRVPLALLDCAWLDNQIIVMLEPRRLAARAAARYMAQSLGEQVGGTVGYRVRLDSKVGPKTHIEVVTEGMLTRRLQHDPELAGTGLIIFDEFHERSLEGDLGLALTLDMRAALRPDLRILLMSATLDAAPLAKLLGDALIISAPGRSFPVETRYRPRANPRLEDDVAAAIRQALRETEGGILAFLPGEAEIRRTAERLSELGAGVTLHPLYGALPAEAQDRAIRPAQTGERKIVLATTIAESSLTIEGIGTVVDCGYKRAPRFDPRTGMTRLETVRISLASAQQRRGRAGRLGPGTCYRLWSEAEERGFAAQDLPEILSADLAPFCLDLAAWGAPDPAKLIFPDAPPDAAIKRATHLLRALCAIDEKGAITGEGRAMAALPLHPRLAHMVAAGQKRGEGLLACDLAALLSERDILGAKREADLSLRLEALQARANGTARIEAAAAQLRRIAGIKGGTRNIHAAGALVSQAYPDRIAQARGARGHFRMSGGGGAVLPETDPLAGAAFLAVAETDGNATEARIFLAAPIEPGEIEALFADKIEDKDILRWDKQTQSVLARRQRLLGALVLEERALAKPDPEAVSRAMLEGVRALGLAALPWTEELRQLQARILFLRRLMPELDLPDLSDEGLTASIGEWLPPFLAGMTRRADLDRLDLKAALSAQIPHETLRALPRLAPERLTIPSGASVRIDYGAETPTAEARLQELFGLLETPKIADGRVALRIALLSPAGRPVAVSQDLAGFWRGAYADVRRDLRGRYPKHLWPEDPLSASPPRPGKTR
jgi:ATP-dependent helicase HrpB